LARGRAPQSAQDDARFLKRERSYPPASGRDSTPAGSTGGSHLVGTAGRYGSSSRRTGAVPLDPALKRRALDLFYKTQGLTRLLRDPKAALKQTELRPLFEGMSPDEMAQAVKALWPGVKLGIGPSIEDGFYYDFDKPEAFAPEDLEKIEAKIYGDTYG
jgi:hypothetical protein